MTPIRRSSVGIANRTSEAAGEALCFLEIRTKGFLLFDAVSNKIVSSEIGFEFFVELTSCPTA